MCVIVCQRIIDVYILPISCAPKLLCGFSLSPRRRLYGAAQSETPTFTQAVGCSVKEARSVTRATTSVAISCFIEWLPNPYI